MGPGFNSRRLHHLHQALGTNSMTLDDALMAKGVRKAQEAAPLGSTVPVSLPLPASPNARAAWCSQTHLNDLQDRLARIADRQGVK